MQSATALIEYLVTGIIASLWFGLAITGYLDLSAQNIKDYKEIIVIAIFPISYVLGIFIDTASSYSIRIINEFSKYITPKIPTFKKMFTFLLKKIAVKPKTEPYVRSAEILSHSPPDIVKTMEAYVSRDRIARGMALNCFIGFCISYFSLSGSNQNLTLAICSIFFALSVMSWFRLRRLSQAFKTEALIQLKAREIARKS
jgi:hypothetical protein